MKTSTQLCSQILALARSEQWDSGTHLAAQGLADRLRVSRQPVNEALQQLEEQGVVRRERNRGFFLALPQSLHGGVGFAAGLRAALLVADLVDRKSTRLNSSHT